MNISQYWQMTHQADPAAARLADKHYSRQKPGTSQFMPAGRKVVLIAPEYDAVFGWVWPYPRYCNRKMLKNAWYCSIFRNESAHLSSDMIREAVAIANHIWGKTLDGAITYVDASKVQSRNPGYCFKKAGFISSGVSTKGYLQLHLPAEEITGEIIPQRYQLSLAI